MIPRNLYLDGLPLRVNLVNKANAKIATCSLCSINSILHYVEAFSCAVQKLPIYLEDITICVGKVPSVAVTFLFIFI